MKRLFILLGVILLSFTLTSCKEDSKYKEYEISKELNEKILSLLTNNTLSYEVFPITLNNIDLYSSEKYSAYYVDVEESDVNYYICGYLDQSIEKDLAENISGIINTGNNTLIGRGFLVTTWAYRIHKNELSLDKYPIYWYKIPKTDEVPLILNNKFLIMVNEILSVTYEEINTNETNKIEMLFENKSFYVDKWNRDDNLYYKGEVLQFIPKFSNKPYEEKIYTAWDYIGEYNYSSLKIVNYNEIKYLNFEDYTIYHNVDLKEKLEYITDEKGNVCFKLKDILKEIGW